MTFAEQQPLRGYHVPYKQGITCPGCGRSHWYIGAASAECAFCGTALQLPQAVQRGGTLFTVTKSRTL